MFEKGQRAKLTSFFMRLYFTENTYHLLINENVACALLSRNKNAFASGVKSDKCVQ